MYIETKVIIFHVIDCAYNTFNLFQINLYELFPFPYKSSQNLPHAVCIYLSFYFFRFYFFWFHLYTKYVKQNFFCAIFVYITTATRMKIIYLSFIVVIMFIVFKLLSIKARMVDLGLLQGHSVI